jgi:hypothetical protein
MIDPKPPTSTKSWLSAANIAWLAAYLVMIGSVVGGLIHARRTALANFDSPEARAQWQEFRLEMKRKAEDPNAPVARRLPPGNEPPTLRLLRDYFPACLVISLLLSSALFVTLMFMLRGVLGGEPFKPNA